MSLYGSDDKTNCVNKDVLNKYKQGEQIPSHFLLIKRDIKHRDKTRS